MSVFSLLRIHPFERGLITILLVHSLQHRFLLPLAHFVIFCNFFHFPIFLCFLLIYTLNGGLARQGSASLPSLGEFAPCPGGIFEYLLHSRNRESSMTETKSHFFSFFVQQRENYSHRKRTTEISI